MDMEYIVEKMGLETLPKLSWLRYVNDTSVLWPHQESVQILLDDVNSTRPSIRLTMEEEINQLSFLDVLMTCTGNGFKVYVFHKPPFTGQYLNFNSHLPYSIQKMIARFLQHRAKIVKRSRNRIRIEHTF